MINSSNLIIQVNYTNLLQKELLDINISKKWKLKVSLREIWNQWNIEHLLRKALTIPARGKSIASPQFFQDSQRILTQVQASAGNEKQRESPEKTTLTAVTQEPCG